MESERTVCCHRLRHVHRSKPEDLPNTRDRCEIDRSMVQLRQELSTKCKSRIAHECGDENTKCANHCTSHVMMIITFAIAGASLLSAIAPLQRPVGKASWSNDGKEIAFISDLDQSTQIWSLPEQCTGRESTTPLQTPYECSCFHSKTTKCSSWIDIV